MNFLYFSLPKLHTDLETQLFVETIYSNHFLFLLHHLLSRTNYSKFYFLTFDLAKKGFKILKVVKKNWNTLKNKKQKTFCHYYKVFLKRFSFYLKLVLLSFVISIFSLKEKKPIFFSNKCFKHAIEYMKKWSLFFLSKIEIIFYLK